MVRVKISALDYIIVALVIAWASTVLNGCGEPPPKPYIEFEGKCLEKWAQPVVKRFASTRVCD